MRNHPRTIFYLQTQIITAGHLLFPELAVKQFPRHKSGDPLTAVVSKIECGIGNIRDHRAGGCLTADPASVKQCLPHRIALDHNSVENLVDIRQKSLFGNKCRVNPHLHFAIIAFYDTKQLDTVAKFIGTNDICQLQLPDTLNIDRINAEPFTISQSRQNRGFMRRIKPVDIQRWIGFCIAEFLGISQYTGEIRPFFLHPGEDIIARTIHNTENLADPVGNQPFA